MKRFALVLAMLGVLGSTVHALAEELPTMTLWKSPWCGCCGNWVEHVRAAGFKVQVKEIEDLGVVKRMAAVPDDMQSCHTARVGGYTVEGHVPASDILRLLDERPNALGLVVPGMPSGSPGMENGEQDPYDVFLLKHDGETEVISSHR
jgi:hypothetical protein